MAALLEVEGLGVVGPGRAWPVAGVDLTLEAGRGLGLLGFSGAGKSLTAQALAGLLPAPLKAQARRFRLDGQELDPAASGTWAGRRGGQVMYLFQSSALALNPHLRVQGQLAEAFRAVRGLSTPTARRLTSLVLEQLDLDPGLGRAYPWELSGGQRQRVCLALALGLRPRLLLADEPTTGLDWPTRRLVLESLARLKAEAGTALVLITHDPRDLTGLVEDLLVLDQGRPVEAGGLAEVLTSPRTGPPRALLAAAGRLRGERG